MIYHKKTQQLLALYGKNPPQALLVVSPVGSGKQTLLEQLAASILGEHPAGRLFRLQPDEDKQTISIDAVRQVKTQLKLTSSKQRVVMITNAELLTHEAQNSLLKVLEEPPQMTVFLLATAHKERLLDTILSRVTVWQLLLPTNEQIIKFFEPNKSLARAMAIANGRVGLISALLGSGETEHPLLASIESAKELLHETKFQRLQRVEQLAKDKFAIDTLLDALELTTKAGLQQAAAKNNSLLMQEWHKKLNEVLIAKAYMLKNVQTKLLLTNLLIKL